MNEGNLKVESVQTTPFEGQKPGTSGLRKPVDIFKQPKYTENFVQSIFNALPKEELNGSTLVVGGDGRYFMGEAVKIIVKMAAANHVRMAMVFPFPVVVKPSKSVIGKAASTQPSYEHLCPFANDLSHLSEKF